MTCTQLTVQFIHADRIVTSLPFDSLAEAYQAATTYADQSPQHLARVYQGETLKAYICFNIGNRYYA